MRIPLTIINHVYGCCYGMCSIAFSSGIYVLAMTDREYADPFAKMLLTTMDRCLVLVGTY